MLLQLHFKFNDSFFQILFMVLVFERITYDGKLTSRMDSLVSISVEAISASFLLV